MKSIHSFLALLLLSVSLSFAQTKPQAATSPASTKPSGSTTTGSSTNRMQELYDEHHGINRKAAITPVRTETQQAGKPADQTETGVSQPERTASSASTSGTRIGFRGGVTYPLFLEKQAFTDPTLGFVGGVTFNFGAGPVSFQPEINYTRNAVKRTEFGYTDTFAVDALEVPLLVKFSTGTYEGNRFFVNVGPYASYAISSGINGKTVSLDGDKGRFGFGGALGVGAALKAGPGHVTIEVRGLYPLGNDDAGFRTDSKTILGQGTVGYIFPLGGR
ncbi:porin family protein [Spirosoma fluviale]|nr:porin family protein [Spirosoma fluviale]